MTTEERHAERRAKRSLTSLSLFIVAYFTNTYSDKDLWIEGKKGRCRGYLIAWAMESLEFESESRIKYLKDALIKAFDDKWTEKLHDKVDETLDKFGWESFIETLP